MNKLIETRDALKFVWENHRNAMIVAIAVGAILGGLFVAIT